EKSDHIASKLGLRLKVVAVCGHSEDFKKISGEVDGGIHISKWHAVGTHTSGQIVAALGGGTTEARGIREAGIRRPKTVGTAHTELIAAGGPEIWDRAIRAGINLAMEASVCGGIPIHAVLREGISGDNLQTLYGILNGTCNYILTEMEKRGAPLHSVLEEAQA